MGPKGPLRGLQCPVIGAIYKEQNRFGQGKSAEEPRHRDRNRALDNVQTGRSSLIFRFPLFAPVRLPQRCATSPAPATSQEEPPPDLQGARPSKTRYPVSWLPGHKQTPASKVAPRRSRRAKILVPGSTSAIPPRATTALQTTGRPVSSGWPRGRADRSGVSRAGSTGPHPDAAGPPWRRVAPPGAPENPPVERRSAGLPVGAVVA